MITVDIALTFTTPYVAHPYWPEMYELIEITKKSGMNRAKSDANRRKALRLASVGSRRFQSGQSGMSKGGYVIGRPRRRNSSKARPRVRNAWARRS